MLKCEDNFLCVAHDGAVTGVAVNSVNSVVITTGKDSCIKFWKFPRKTQKSVLITCLKLESSAAMIQLHRDRSNYFTSLFLWISLQLLNVIFTKFYVISNSCSCSSTCSSSCGGCSGFYSIDDTSDPSAKDPVNSR